MNEVYVGKFQLFVCFFFVGLWTELFYDASWDGI